MSRSKRCFGRDFLCLRHPIGARSACGGNVRGFVASGFVAHSAQDRGAVWTMALV
jgi:hypothetical protein